MQNSFNFAFGLLNSKRVRGRQRVKVWRWMGLGGEAIEWWQDMRACVYLEQIFVLVWVVVVQVGEVDCGFYNNLIISTHGFVIPCLWIMRWYPGMYMTGCYALKGFRIDFRSCLNIQKRERLFLLNKTINSCFYWNVPWRKSLCRISETRKREILSINWIKTELHIHVRGWIVKFNFLLLFNLPWLRQGRLFSHGWRCFKMEVISTMMKIKQPISLITEEYDVGWNDRDGWVDWNCKPLIG